MLPRLRTLPIWRWLRDHQKLTIIIGLLSLLVSVLGVANQIFPEFGFGDAAPPSTQPSRSASRPVKTWSAAVVNTWSDEKQKDSGVYSARNPYAKAPPVRSYFEQNSVEVRCYVPDGRFITTTTRGIRYESQIWYLTTNNDWLSDVFVDLDDKNVSPRMCYPEERPSPLSSPSG